MVPLDFLSRYPARFIPYKTSRLILGVSCALSMICLTLHARKCNRFNRPLETEYGLAATSPSPIPDFLFEYNRVPSDSEECSSMFGLQYLRSMISTNTEYCKNSRSRSILSCFTSDLLEQRRDTFCIASQMTMNPNLNKLNLNCELREWNSEDIRRAPRFAEFPKYWYDTGPRNIFDRFIDISGHTDSERSGCQFDESISHTVLIKREGAFNLWHSLMEIFSYTMSMDVLSLVSDGISEKPYFGYGDVNTTQVVILDDDLAGPYFDLWHLMAKLPIQRVGSLNSSISSCLNNIIIPLPGASNPLWEGDWEALDCMQSQTLRVFIDRIFSHYHFQRLQDSSRVMRVTFIDRKHSRKFIDQGNLLSILQRKYPSIQIEAIDLAAFPFEQQIAIIQATDVLAGVHGAGLTHSMFLPARSSIVEILPSKLAHKGFRNLAKLRNLQYFSTHAISNDVRGDEDWHLADVSLEESRFIKIMDAAILSVFNRGTLNIEV